MTQPALAFNKRGMGRHYRHPVTGDEVPSVTSVIDCLAKPALVGWASKETARYAFRNRKALAALDDEEAALDLLKGAPYKTREKRADVGSTVHAIAEALAQDEPLPEFGSEEESYANGFLQWVADHDVRFHAVEVTVFDVEGGYAGTFDFDADVDDRRVIGDHKTGKGVYDEVALQLAALSWAPEQVVDGEVVSPPHYDGAVVVHLKPNDYVMYEADVGERARNTFLALREVWDWHRGGFAEGAVQATKGDG